MVMPPTVLLFSPRGVGPAQQAWQIPAGALRHQPGFYLARCCDRSTFVVFAKTFKPARATLEGIDGQLEQAARVLGISETGIFLRVTLPLAWRSILANDLLAFARALGKFGATLMVAGSIPGKMHMRSIAVYKAVQAGQDDTATLLVLITSVVCATVLLSAGQLATGRIAHRLGFRV